MNRTGLTRPSRGAQWKHKVFNGGNKRPISVFRDEFIKAAASGSSGREGDDKSLEASERSPGEMTKRFAL